MRRARLDALLDSALRIRPGEARRVALMFLFLMAVVSTFIVGRTVRDTLFLSRYRLERLPLMYVAVAASVALASYAYSRFADRHRRDRLVVGSLVISAGTVLLFWSLLYANIGGDGLYPALYVAVEIIGAISIIQFWTLANDIYNSREAKRLFGVIGAGGVISNIFCGFIIGSIVPIIGSENLLLVCALLLVLSVIVVRKIAAIAEHDLDQAIRKPRKVRIGIAADSGALLQSRHLQIIAAIVAVTFLTVTIIDYQFKVVAKGAYDEAGLAAYFGYFYGFTGIVASLVQFFVTGRILERSGIVISLAVLPVGLLAGAGSMIAVPIVGALTAATVAKGAENIFRYTINDATTQLLYVPVPSHYRGRAKAFIDGILKPVSIGSAGLLLLALGRVIPRERFALDLAYLDLVLIAVWILLVVGIRREYVKSLISTLHARRLDLSGPWSLISDDATIKLLKRSLSSGVESEVLHALELVPSLDADYRTELALLLEHPSRRVRIEALRLIALSQDASLTASVRPLLEHGDEEVRAAAVGAFCAMGRERAIRETTAFLSDPSAPVRGAAVAALIKHGGLDGILTAADALKSILKSPDPGVRFEGAHILAEIQVRNFFQPVLELLEDPDPRVQLGAIEAAGAMQSPELAPPLIRKLGERPEIAQASLKALMSFGAPIERLLFRALEDTDEVIAVRRKIPRVLAHVGGQEAITKLIENLTTPDPELRVALARSASRIRERSPRVRVDDELLDSAIHTEIREAYQALATIEDMRPISDALLAEALLVRHRARLGLAFRLLEIRYPARTIQLVYSNLDAESKSMRANALEVADNVLSREESRLLLPLLEDHSRAEKVRRGAELFAIDRRTPRDWVKVLLDDPHAWIVVSTLHLAGDPGFLATLRSEDISSLRDEIAHHLKSPDAVVRETACLTLARLVERIGGAPATEKAELTRLATEVAGDVAPEVRRAGTSLLQALAAGVASPP